MADINALKATHQAALAAYGAAQAQTNDPKVLAAKKKAADDAGEAWAAETEKQMRAQKQPASARRYNGMGAQ
jgi:hypothetical protein